MYGIIRRYHFHPKDSDEIDRMIRTGFVPLLKGAKGFVSYHWLDDGNGEGASFSIFLDKAGAEESLQLAADFVRDRLSKVVRLKPEVIEGPIVAHS